MGWVSYYGASDWGASLGTWDGSKWNSVFTYTNIIWLGPFGIWANGYRPSKVKITLSIPTSASIDTFFIQDTSSNYIVGPTYGYPADPDNVDHEQYFTFSGLDIKWVYLDYSGGPFAITNIEFWEGSSSSSSSSSSNSSSSSSLTPGWVSIFNNWQPTYTPPAYLPQATWDGVKWKSVGYPSPSASFKQRIILDRSFFGPVIPMSSTKMRLSLSGTSTYYGVSAIDWYNLYMIPTSASALMVSIPSGGYMPMEEVNVNYPSPSFYPDFIRSLRRLYIDPNVPFNLTNIEFYQGSSSSYSSSSSSYSSSSRSSSSSSSSSSSRSSSSSSSSRSSSSSSSSSSLSFYAYKTFWYELRDLAGIPISGATVNTTLSNIFEIDGVTPKSQPIITGVDGLINFAVIDNVVSPSGYKWDDEFTLTWSKNISAGMINFRQIFGEYHTVELDKTDTKINKTINDQLANIWNSHIGLLINSSSSSSSSYSSSSCRSSSSSSSSRSSSSSSKSSSSSSRSSSSSSRSSSSSSSRSSSSSSRSSSSSSRSSSSCSSSSRSSSSSSSSSNLCIDCEDFFTFTEVDGDGDVTVLLPCDLNVA